MTRQAAAVDVIDWVISRIPADVNIAAFEPDRIFRQKLARHRLIPPSPRVIQLTVGIPQQSAEELLMLEPLPPDPPAAKARHSQNCDPQTTDPDSHRSRCRKTLLIIEYHSLIPTESVPDASGIPFHTFSIPCPAVLRSTDELFMICSHSKTLPLFKRWKQLCIGPFRTLLRFAVPG